MKDPLIQLRNALRSFYGNRFGRLHVSRSHGLPHVHGYDRRDRKPVEIVAENTPEGVAVLDIRPA
jgi:hypothetical protein